MVGKKRNSKNLKTSKKINKALVLNNVQFQLYSVINDKPKIAIIENIEFLKPVNLLNVTNLVFRNIKFDHKINVEYSPIYNQQNKYKQINFDHIFIFDNCFFRDGLNVDDSAQNKTQVQFNVLNSIIKSKNNTKKNNDFFPYSLNFKLTDIWNFDFANNYVEGIGVSQFYINKIDGFEFSDNVFTKPVSLKIDNHKRTNIKNNQFKKQLFLETTNESNSEFTLDYKQFDKNLFSYNLNTYFYNEHNKLESNFIADTERFSERNIQFYLENAIIKNEFVYKNEQKLKGRLYQMYRQNFDTDFANLVYADIKDLETKRSGYLYKQNPSFKSFFTWKINQFLKVFSAYGTEHARAVVFSMYVILLFAFIYLLFPNSWDSHGRKRIMDRYSFFFTYMNKKSGIHEVYLDNQKEELLEFDEFKKAVEQQGKTVPKFFTATALPLYKWAVSGTKFSASVLKRFDIMKGTWNEVPKKKRVWKSILLIGAFLIAICYDVIIKMLNALMLSINTFTTLGFGEIPIKGLPRYLAIIQGFIGWFMLTIFSVSLISQLLN